MEMAGQGVVEHVRIELIGLAVEVEPGAGKIGLHQWCAHGDRGAEQFVHKAVFGAAQVVQVKPRLSLKAIRVVAAGMGRIENHRRSLQAGAVDPEAFA